MARITQKSAILEAIRNKPGITRSELFDLYVNGARIAGLTARVSELNKDLKENGEKIVCGYAEPLKINGSLIRCTTYRIVPLEPEEEKKPSVFVPTESELEKLGFTYDWFRYRHPSGLEFSVYAEYVSWKVEKMPIFYHTDTIWVYPKSLEDVKKIISLITP